MITTFLAMDNGSNLRFARINVDYTDLNTTAGLTKALTLFTLPKGGIIMYVGIKERTVSAGCTSLTVSVGNSSSATAFTSAVTLMGVVADAKDQETNVMKSVGDAAQSVIATFTATVNNLTSLTQGNVDIYVLYTPVTTP